MRLANNVVEVKQDVQGDSVVMGIKAEHMGKVMGLLAGAYSNKVLAIIREYATNAYDSHIEAGTEQPIEVTLPSAMRPAFSVKDYGTGLSVEDIHNVYAMYGYSTKDESNDFTGALGIGCKSALAYCSAFTVESVKDGTKIIVSVSREASGAGRMTVVDTVSTTEPNGTRVTVPVQRHDVYKFAQEAESLFEVWPEGSVLVNGAAPKRFEGLKLADDLYIVQDASFPRIVMGNVPYPAPGLNSVVPQGALLAFVPLGTVSFPPSREALDDDRTTQATVDRIKADYARHIVGAIQREVDQAATPQEAVKTVLKWWRYIPPNTAHVYTYKGHKLPTHFERPQQLTDVVGEDQQQMWTPPLLSTDNRYGRLGDASKHPSWPINQWPTTVWVYNYTPAKFNAQHKKKIRKWCEAQGITLSSTYQMGVGRVNADATHFVMIPEGKPSSPFIDPARCADWEVVRKIQLQPRAVVNGNPRVPGSYDLYTEAGFQHGVPGDSIRQDCPLFYIRGNRYNGRAFADALKVSYPKFTLVCLPANRVEKFRRILPQTKTAADGVAESFKLWLGKLSADQRLALHMADACVFDTLRQIDPAKIKHDKDLRNAARVAKIDVKKLTAQRNAFRYVVNVKEASKVADWKNPLVKYPLFSESILRTKPDHVYAYINAGIPA